MTMTDFYLNLRVGANDVDPEMCKEFTKSQNLQVERLVNLKLPVEPGICVKLRAIIGQDYRRIGIKRLYYIIHEGGLTNTAVDYHQAQSLISEMRIISARIILGGS